MDNSSSSSSTLLSQLLQKKMKDGLNPARTRTTYPDGTVQYFSAQGSCCDLEDKTEKSYGFVVDEKPDLTVGEVTPWLFVSSQDVPNDAALVRKHNISHVLSLLPGFVLVTETANMIKSHLILEIYDEVSFLIDSEVLRKAFQFIENAKVENGRALVHCNAGLSRAPSVAIAYLMKQEHLTFDQAWEQVKRVRPQMQPNSGFKQQLQKLHSINNIE